MEGNSPGDGSDSDANTIVQGEPAGVTWVYIEGKGTCNPRWRCILQNCGRTFSRREYINNHRIYKHENNMPVALRERGCPTKGGTTYPAKKCFREKMDWVKLQRQMYHDNAKVRLKKKLTRMYDRVETEESKEQWISRKLEEWDIAFQTQFSPEISVWNRPGKCGRRPTNAPLSDLCDLESDIVYKNEGSEAKESRENEIQELASPNEDTSKLLEQNSLENRSDLFRFVQRKRASLGSPVLDKIAHDRATGVYPLSASRGNEEPPPLSNGLPEETPVGNKINRRNSSVESEGTTVIINVDDDSKPDANENEEKISNSCLEKGLPPPPPPPILPPPPPPPSAAAASASSDDNKGRVEGGPCVVCWDAPARGVCIPCGHLAGCMNCLMEIKEKTWGCPVCRTSIQQVIKVFTV